MTDDHDFVMSDTIARLFTACFNSGFAPNIKKSFMSFAQFPTTRMRRTRQFGWSRRLVAESTLSVDDLIWPVFVQEGNGLKTEIESISGCYRMSIDVLNEAVAEAAELGIPAIVIFPQTDPAEKTDEFCHSAMDKTKRWIQQIWKLDDRIIWDRIITGCKIHEHQKPE